MQYVAGYDVDTYATSNEIAYTMCSKIGYHHFCANSLIKQGKQCGRLKFTPYFLSLDQNVLTSNSRSLFSPDRLGINYSG